jgi:hypothetical protein
MMFIPHFIKVRQIFQKLLIETHTGTIITKAYFAFVKFKILTAGNMKMAVFWDFAACSLVEIDRRFRGAYCLHHKGDEDEGGSKHL